MTSGITFRQGDILIVPFPYSDLSSIKQRPVLVLSSNIYNSNTTDIVVCAITSNLKDTIFSVLIDNKDLIEGSIPITSRIKVDKIITLNKNLVKKNIGSVSNKIFDKIKSELFKLF